MRLILIHNWSILLGFTISSFAFIGMFMAAFFPGALEIDLTPSRSLSALEVPLKHFDPNALTPEERVINEYKASLAPVEVLENKTNVQIEEMTSVVNQQTTNHSKPSSPPAEPASDVVYQPPPSVPVRILIPSINLDAPVIPAPVDFETVAGKEFLQWFVPDEYAVGWHTTSAMLGEPGNTVLNGHHNAYGEVFVSLVDINEGDIIWVESDQSRYSYQVTNKMILPEKYEQLDVRMNNAQWIMPSVDERLTIITCWPYESNTHRLIIVARPLTQEPIDITFD